MGVEETMRKIDEFWGPIERDVDDEGLIPPRDQDFDDEDGEALGVETRYIRIREVAVEMNREDRVPYVRLVGDLDHGDAEMRLPISMLENIAREYATLAAEMGVAGPGKDPA